MAVTLRDLVLRLSADPAWAETIASELTAAIHRELPQLRADDELARDTYASTASVVALFIDRVGRDASLTSVEPPDAAIAFARELVRRGLPLDDLLRSYHIGQARFFDRWVAEVRTILEDPADVAQAVEQAAAATFAFVRALDSGLVRRWATERERWVRTTAAAQADTVRALLAGDEQNAVVAGGTLGYNLAHVHTAFVVWEPDSPAATLSDPGRLERAATAVADALGGRGRLIVPLRGSLAAGWVDAGDSSALTGGRLPRQTIAGTLVAVGSSGAGLEGFRRSHQEALDARRVARLSGRRAGSVVSYTATAVAALASSDLDRARTFVAAELGSIAADDDEARRLAGTLLVYLEEGLSPRRTARRLGVHENTVTNRVKAIEDRLGRPVKSRMTELLVALRLAPLLH
jgi:PucR C-terminal helix-turn-helix domain/GGDEF-like domain